MIIEKIGEGTSFEAAVEDAKLKLMAPDDAELHFETIREAKKKLFGLKVEPAQVKVWYEAPDPKPVKTEKPAEKKPVEKKHVENKQNDKKPAEKKAEAKSVKTEAKPAKAEAPKAKEPKPAKEEAPKTVTAPAQDAAKTLIPTDENDATVKYLKMLANGMGIEDCNIILEKYDDSDEYVYTIDCGDADGALIGRRGETLDAIQYLLRLSINKGLDEDKHRKVSVNVGNYREKRNENLRALAAKSARQVLKYGRNVALEPMNPYERRIIHTAIQGIEGVTSHSVGSDSNRKVIISLEEGVEPTNPSRGGYRGGRRDGGRGGHGGRGGYQKKEPYKPAVTREPRKDAAGSLYGKIEIPAKNDED